eukprot:5545242-Amphidinium_carterae.1
MSMYYAPDFFKTIKDQRRDDLRALNWDEVQVRAMETNLQGQTTIGALHSTTGASTTDVDYLWEDTYELHEELHGPKTSLLQLPQRSALRDYGLHQRLH